MNIASDTHSAAAPGEKDSPEAIPGRESDEKPSQTLVKHIILANSPKRCKTIPDEKYSYEDIIKNTYSNTK